MNLVIFDLETTGLSPANDHIIQIAAVRIRDGQVVPGDFHSTYVDPGCRIPPFIASYTGITNKHVKGAPTIAEALPAFSRFVGDDVLLAHNGHRFDMPFIHQACVRTGAPTRPIVYADSLDFSRRIWCDCRKHGLDAVIERLGLNIAGHRRHDARGDVGILAEAVLRMWRHLTPDCACLPIPVHPGRLTA